MVPTFVVRIARLLDHCDTHSRILAYLVVMQDTLDPLVDVSGEQSTRHLSDLLTLHLNWLPSVNFDYLCLCLVLWQRLHNSQRDVGVVPGSDTGHCVPRHDRRSLLAQRQRCDSGL